MPSFAGDDVLTKVAKRLHRGAGPEGAESHLLKDMLLLRFNQASIGFRAEMTAWVAFLANGLPPFAAYISFTNGLLLTGNEQP